MVNKFKNDKMKGNNLSLFYMTPSQVIAKELAEIFFGESSIKVELWSEMNILELELPNRNAIDFEPIEFPFQDPSDATFVNDKNIQTIFSINLLEEDLSIMLPFFEQIILRYSGFVCSDSEDFQPVYSGSFDS